MDEKKVADQAAGSTIRFGVLVVAGIFRKPTSLLLLSTLGALLLATLIGSWGWTLAAPASRSVPAATASTAFAYQGQLRDGGRAADGSYDFTFTLYDALSGGVVVGGPVSKPGVAVEQGFFAVELDFGAVFDGSPRYLELAVRPAGAGQVLSILSPRQRIAPVPYALYQLLPVAPHYRSVQKSVFTTTGSPISGSR